MQDRLYIVSSLLIDEKTEVEAICVMSLIKMS